MIRPLNDFVLVEREKEPEKTVGGLYIPDQAKEKPTLGRVLAVGPGKSVTSDLIDELDGLLSICETGVEDEKVMSPQLLDALKSVAARLRMRAPSVTAGARVVFGKFSGNAVTVDERECQIMREEEIYGVVEE